MISPRRWFFCVVKCSFTAEAASSSRSEAVAREIRRVPTKSLMSERRNAASSSEVPEYSPGRRRKKNAIHIISAKACSAGTSGPLIWASRSKKRTKVIGTGLTRSGGLSSLDQKRD